MSHLCLWANSDLPVNILAVIGGFTLGGFLGGWIFALLAKAAFNQKVPNWLAWALRLLSGLVAAWLVWMWVFGSGGGGFGGSGFGLGGNGTAKDKADKDGKPDKKTDPFVPPKEKDPPEKSKPDGPGIGSGESMRVEVLGNGPLKKLAGEREMNPEKRYRIAEAPSLRTLEEIKKLILERRSQTPPLRQLVVIIYSDSPDKDNPYVKDLVFWAKDLDDKGGLLLVEYTEPPRAAPLK